MTLVKSRKKNKKFQVLKFLQTKQKTKTKQKQNKTKKQKQPKLTGVNFTPKKFYWKKLVKMWNDVIHPSHDCMAIQQNSTTSTTSYHRFIVKCLIDKYSSAMV